MVAGTDPLSGQVVGKPVRLVFELWNGIFDHNGLNTIFPKHLRQVTIERALDDSELRDDRTARDAGGRRDQEPEQRLVERDPEVLEVEPTGEPGHERTPDRARRGNEKLRDVPDPDDALPGADDHDEHERHQGDVRPPADEGARRAPEFLERREPLRRRIGVVDHAHSSHPFGPSICRIFRV